MKFLLTTPYSLYPPNWGGAVRTVALARALRDKGHSVSLLSANGTEFRRHRDGMHWYFYPSRGSLAHFFNRGFRRALLDALKSRPDVVVQAFPYQAAITVPATKRAGIPLVYDAHNVEATRFTDLHGWFAGKAMQYFEGLLCRHANLVLAVSESDCKALQHLYHCQPCLAPNGVDGNYLVPGERSQDLLTKYRLEGQSVVLFFGKLDYRPNTEAAQFLVSNWAQVRRHHPSATLLLVGDHPPVEIRAPGVVCTGAVSSMADHIRLAHLVVSPLSSGGGTRLKILEALACGRPVLSTPMGATGLNFVESQGLQLAELENFIPALIDCLDRAKQGSMGTKPIDSQHYWSSIVDRIDWNPCPESQARQ